MIGQQVVCENVPRTQAQAKRDWLTLTANVLHCLVLRAHRKQQNVSGSPYCSLKTAQKKQENLKGRFHVLMHEVFLTEVFYRKVESNRIDFPEESLMK